MKHNLQSILPWEDSTHKLVENTTFMAYTF